MVSFASAYVCFWLRSWFIAVHRHTQISGRMLHRRRQRIVSTHKKKKHSGFYVDPTLCMCLYTVETMHTVSTTQIAWNGRRKERKYTYAGRPTRRVRNTMWRSHREINGKYDIFIVLRFYVWHRNKRTESKCENQLQKNNETEKYNHYRGKCNLGEALSPSLTRCCYFAAILMHSHCDVYVCVLCRWVSSSWQTINGELNVDESPAALKWLLVLFHFRGIAHVEEKATTNLLWRLNGSPSDG